MKGASMCIFFDIENYICDTEEFLRETDIILNLVLNQDWNASEDNMYSAVSVINLINQAHFKLLENFSKKIYDEYKKISELSFDSSD